MLCLILQILQIDTATSLAVVGLSRFINKIKVLSEFETFPREDAKKVAHSSLSLGQANKKWNKYKINTLNI